MTLKPEELIQKLVGNRPMSPAGAVLTETGSGITSEIGSAIPLYTLHHLEQENGSAFYNIGIHDRMYPNNWSVKGYDIQDVAFYGFNSKMGQWILVDEEGREVTEGSIACIGVEPLTNEMYIQGEGEGTVYAKYLIEDNYYICKEGKPITNEGIRTVYVKIDVHPSELEGHITVDGSLTVAAGSVTNLEAVRTLDVSVYDEQDRRIPVPVMWEAKDGSSCGVLILHNQMSVINPGTFYIRARYENLVSDWVEVRAVRV